MNKHRRIIINKIKNTCSYQCSKVGITKNRYYFILKLENHNEEVIKIVKNYCKRNSLVYILDKFSSLVTTLFIFSDIDMSIHSNNDTLLDKIKQFGNKKLDITEIDKLFNAINDLEYKLRFSHNIDFTDRRPFRDNEIESPEGKLAKHIYQLKILLSNFYIIDFSRILKIGDKLGFEIKCRNGSLNIASIIKAYADLNYLECSIYSNEDNFSTFVIRNK